MKNWNPITKFLAIFMFALIVLICISLSKNVRKKHCQYFCFMTQPIMNLVNPHIFSELEEGALENTNDWDVSFRVWDKRKYDEKIFLKSFRQKNPPKALLYQNSHELFFIPTLFLIALFVASPVKLKSKLIRFPISLLCFYLFMSLYLSYRFELTMNGNDLPIDSIWHAIIWFFGLGGNTDPIYIVVFLIWLFLLLPFILKMDFEKLFRKDI